MKKILLCIAGMSLIFAGTAMADCGGVPCPEGVVGSSSTSTGISQQSQGQGQSQGQSSNSGLTNSGNSGVTFENSFNGSSPIRYLPGASGITYTGMAPNMFSRPDQDKGANFIGSNNLIGIQGAWAVDNLYDPDFEVDDVEIDITEMGVTALSDEALEAIKTIHFSVQGSATQIIWKENRRVLAMGSMQADDKEINSVELFMTLAVKAKERGATAVVIVGEGVKIDLKSFGWGIGFSYNYASVTSAQDGHGSVGAGGTGISGGTAGYTKMPYLTFAFLE